MKTKLLIYCLIFTSFSIAQPIVNLRTGNIVNNNIEKNPTSHTAFFADNIYDGKYFLWLQFNTFPNDIVKSQIEKTGVTFFDYLPNNTFIASFPSYYNFNNLKSIKEYSGVCKPQAAYKIDNVLFNTNEIKWALENDKIKVDVSLINYIHKQTIINNLKANYIQFETLYNNSNDVITLKATLEEIIKIAAHPLVQYIEPIGHPGEVEDMQGFSNHRASSVQTTDNWTNGKKIDGNEVVIAIGDDGFVGPHLDFEGRILSNANNTSASSTHADHCAGIMTGAGNFNPTVKGQAKGADLLVFDSYDPYSLFPSIYNSDRVRVISHSLGQGCGANNYTANARTNDQLLRAYPNLMHTHSSGNSGTDPVSFCSSILSGGFRSITGGFKAGKNVTTVGNLDKTDAIASSSSKGPLHDGRIKPEITAVGTNVNSTQPNNTYVNNSGTSMACPAIAGSYALLQQAYKLKYTNEAEGAYLKAVMMNSADDLGNEGPDFSYGFGRVNVRRAVKAIEEARFYTNTISTNGSNNHVITIPANVLKARVMLYWSDKEATAGAAKTLVNNLDAKITSPDNTTVTLPWVIDLTGGIDGTNVATPAINSIDSINNVEQIQLDNPTAGTYTLNVFGKAIPSGPQKYYVVYEFDYKDEIVVTYPIGGETFAPGETQRIRWDASEGTASFQVHYSVNGGSTWTALSTGVAANRRYYDWAIAAGVTVTNKALIRVTRGAFNDVSDTNFVIIRVPTNITFTPICESQVKVNWTGVLGANSYDVFRLGNKYMELAASTVAASGATSVVVSNVPNGVEQWYAVRAKVDVKNSNGRLTNAVTYTNNSSVVCIVPVKLISFDAILKDEIVNIKWITTNEIGISKYVIEKSTSPGFESFEVVSVIKAKNINNEQTYSFQDKSTLTNNVFYRLKIVENDKVSYSNIKQISNQIKVINSITLFPNPAKKFLNLTINSVDSKNATIKIINELGIVVLENKNNVLQKGNVIKLTTITLNSGNYFVQVMDEETKQIIYKQSILVLND